jgi:hypothetical protein
VQPHEALTVELEYSYFIRTDTVSFADNREPEKVKEEGYFAGGEWYGKALWMVLPDLAVSMGGGAFFPGMGNVFERGAAIRWKAGLGLIVSL